MHQNVPNLFLMIFIAHNDIHGSLEEGYSPGRGRTRLRAQIDFSHTSYSLQISALTRTLKESRMLKILSKNYNYMPSLCYGRYTLVITQHMKLKMVRRSSGHVLVANLISIHFRTRYEVINLFYISEAPPQ